MDYDPYTIKEQFERVQQMPQPKNLDTWDPMREDFEDKDFNRYSQGPGRYIPSDKAIKREYGEKVHELYITGIPVQMSETGLTNLFGEYGEVVRCVKKSTAGSNFTYGFVRYNTSAEASQAMTGLNGKSFMGGEVVMRVKFAKSEAQKEEERRRKEYNDTLMRGVEEALNMPSSDSDSVEDRRINDIIVKSKTTGRDVNCDASGGLKISLGRHEEQKLQKTETNGRSSGYSSDGPSPGLSRGSPIAQPAAPASKNSPAEEADVRKVVTKTPPSQHQPARRPQLSHPAQPPPVFASQPQSYPGNGPFAYGRGNRVGFQGPDAFYRPPCGRGYNMGGAFNPGFAPGPRNYPYSNQDYGFNPRGVGPYSQYPRMDFIPTGGDFGGYHPFQYPPSYDTTYDMPYNRGGMGVAPPPFGMPQYNRPPPVYDGRRPPLLPDPVIYPGAPPRLPSPRRPQARIGQCFVCKAKTNNRCSICQSVYYCSKTCQSDHWKIHKKECEAVPPLEQAATSERAQPKTGGQESDGSKSSECVFFRGQGCSYGDNCRYAHIAENQGVDKEKYEFMNSSQKEKAETGGKERAETGGKEKKAETPVASASAPEAAKQRKPNSINTRPSQSFDERFVVDMNEDALKAWAADSDDDKPPAPRASPATFAITTPSPPSTSNASKSERKEKIPPTADRVASGRKVQSPDDTSPRAEVNHRSRLSTDSDQRNVTVARGQPEVRRVTLDMLTKERIGTASRVQVSEAVGPNDFWLVKEECVPESDELRLSMTKEYSGRRDAYTPLEQEVVAAKFRDDDSWYRACVQSLDANGSCLVRFVDFGNSAEAASDEVQPLGQRFCGFPVQAEHCMLGVRPASALGEWSEEAKNIIYNQLQPLAKTYVINSFKDSGDKKLVTLTDVETGKDLTELLVGAKLAVSLKKPEPTERGEVKDGLSQPQQVETGAVCEPRAVTKIPPPPPLKELPLPSQLKRGLFCGNKVTVKVTEVASPSQFWVNVDCPEFGQKLPELEEKLQPHYEKKAPKNTFRPNGNNLYAAKSQRDNRWHRALGYDQDFECVSVLYLDSGLREYVPFSRLHNLESDFCSLPFQAVCCAVAYVAPSGGGEDWRSEECEQFRGFLHSGVFTADVKDKDDVRAYVDLIVNDHSLREHMLKQGVGIAKPKPHDSGSGKANMSSPTALRHDEAASAFRSPPAAQRSVVPSAATAPAHNQPAAKGQSKNSRDAGQSKASSVMYPYVRLGAGRQPVVGVHVNGVQDFYVHSYDPECTELFGRMENDLKNTYESSAPGYTPSVGELVAVYYSKDSQWFRGVTLQVQPEVVVKFCDYGNGDVIPRQCVRELLPHFVEMPWQAIRCSLYGLTDETCRWSARAIGHFVQLVLNRPLQIDVGDVCNGQLIVRGVYDSDGNDLVQHLIDQRHLAEAESGRPVTSAPVAPLAADEQVAVPQAAGSQALPRAPEMPDDPSTPRQFRVEAFPADGAAVVVTHANSPADLYVQRCDRLEQLEGLAVSLHNECTYADAMSYTPQAAGHIVAAKFLDIFSRAEVRTVGGGACEVFFIDYGNTARLSVTDLRAMPEGHMELPAQALQCRIAGIQGGEAGGVFSAEACQWFSSRVVDVPGITIQYAGGESRMKAVDLLLGGSESMREGLVAKQYAAPAGRDAGPNLQPVASTVPDPRASTLPDPRGSTLPDPRASTLPDPRASTLPDSCTVVVTEVLSSLDFYCLCFSQETAEYMAAITRQVNEHCAATNADPAYMPAPHDLCAALFSEDLAWYRARVGDVTSSSTLPVFFVDYGNSDKVGVADVRPYQPVWDQVPFLAVRCRLDGVTSAHVPQDAVEEFKALVLSKEVDCTVVRREGGVHVVRIVSTGSDQATDINNAVQRLLPAEPLSLEEENRRLKEQLAKLMAAANV